MELRNSKGQFIKGKRGPRSETERKKISIGVKKQHLEGRARTRKKGEWSPTLEMNKKNRESHIGMITGDKNPNWKGGISKNPYPAIFNNELKLKIRTRDNFTCVLCDRTEREELEEFNRVLCVNHINFDKQDCREDNLNTLCLRCNIKINKERDFWTDYFNQQT